MFYICEKSEEHQRQTSEEYRRQTSHFFEVFEIDKAYSEALPSMNAAQQTREATTNNEYNDDESFTSISSSAAEQIENFMLNLCKLSSFVTSEGSDNNIHTEAKEITDANPLSDAISRFDWQAATKIVKSQPSLAQATSSCDGMIPLHQALDAGAPLKVIKKLLEAYPQAAHTKCGEHNRLPIHYHLASKAVTPQESIVSLLIESFPESTRAGDADNQLPIHLACQAARVSGQIFAILLCSFPEGACVRDIHGNYPCDYATWNEDAETKKIALSALVQNDAMEMSRSFRRKPLSNPKIFDEQPLSARTQKRKRLENEVTFSMLNSYDELLFQ